ncbi:MAG: rubredoxin [Bacteroidales bacterium]|jgi:rubredoxin|nr:rubredoxin [Bacteroidales bacterium]NPV35683.1 rubredoxin [Bacteroidales bacterium]
MEENPNQHYRCMLCEYTYRPEKGDPLNGIPPGTPFDDLPDDWTCPKCGASKTQFYPAD